MARAHVPERVHDALMRQDAVGGDDLFEQHIEVSHGRFLKLAVISVSSPRRRRAVRRMIHCVTVHARPSRRKPVPSGCRDSERDRACDFALAFLLAFSNRSRGGGLPRQWSAMMGMLTTSRSGVGTSWSR